MNKKSSIAVSLILVALLSAYFILKPDAVTTSDGHTDSTHRAVQDESKPHTHEE